jgi:hypothetical protein
MRACEQTTGLSIWRHGELVSQRYAGLVRAMRQAGADAAFGLDLALPDWRIPEWLRGNAQLLLELQVDFETAQRYQLWHDCGKPFCVELDDNGRRHFPDHARVSGLVWRALGGVELECELIEQDMDAHQLAAAGLDEFAARRTAATLLLTGLAEIHANAEMFGGLESVGFKSKWKHLDRRGLALCERWAR